MKRILCAAGMLCASVSSAFATTYPVTIDNCGFKLTFTKPPERVVALGQNTVEILLLLGLQDKVIASAFWPSKVLPELAEKNAKVKTLTVEIPTLESILAQDPDFVPAQLPLLLGPESKVAKRADFDAVGVNSYMSPGMCATKKDVGDMYGSRQKLWDMTYLYKEIEDLATIFNVEDRGQVLINDFKNREENCVRNSVKTIKISHLSSGFPAPRRPLMRMLAVKTAHQDLSLMFWAAITALPLKLNGPPSAGKALLL